MDLKKIKEKIKTSGYTLQHVALSLNLSNEGLRNKLNGKYKFTIEEASELSKILMLSNKEKLEFFL